MPHRARIYDAGFGLLFDVELEDGRSFSWQTPGEVRELIRTLRLEPWPAEPPATDEIPDSRPDTSGGWFVY